MDSLTLTAVIFIFLLCLALYHATAPPPPPPPPPPPVKQHPLLHPAVLRQNVAVARLMRQVGV